MTNLNQGWGRKLKLASVPVILAGLAACATPFKADVSRFQTQLPAPQGETYFVVADDPALTATRLFLAQGIGQIIRNGLALMGVVALTEMQ